MKGRWPLKLSCPGVRMGGKGYEGVLAATKPGVMPPRTVLTGSVDAVSGPALNGVSNAASKDGDIVSSWMGETLAFPVGVKVPPPPLSSLPPNCLANLSRCCVSCSWAFIAARKRSTSSCDVFCGI